MKDARDILGDIPPHTTDGRFPSVGPADRGHHSDTVKDMQEFGLKRIVPAALHRLARCDGVGAGLR
jgi:hypothetical protein